MLSSLSCLLLLFVVVVKKSHQGQSSSKSLPHKRSSIEIKQPSELVVFHQGLGEKFHKD